MGARRVQGDFKLSQGYIVATGQQVDVMDLVGYPAATVVRASDTAWGTAIATASAPVVTDVALAFGSGLTNAATLVKVSYQTPWGEGTLSASGSVTPTANGGIELAAIALPTGVTGLNVYVEDAAGSGVYKLYDTTLGQQILITGYGTGRVPPTAVATGAKEVTQYNFALTFLGVSNQRMATTGFFGTPTRPFGNSSDNQIMVCRGGVFEFDCASASFAAGTYVGAAKASGNALLNQTVAAVSAPALAIGKVFKDATSVTKVMVEIMSRFATPAPSPSNAW